MASRPPRKSKSWAAPAGSGEVAGLHGAAETRRPFVGAVVRGARPAAIAAAALAAAATRSAPVTPRPGIRTKTPVHAPAAPPRVLAPYREPVAPAAPLDEAQR